MPKKKTPIVIVGDGVAPKRAVHAALDDLFGSTNIENVTIVWPPGETADDASLREVVSWVVDVGVVPLYIFAESKDDVPKRIASEVDNIVESDNPVTDAFSYIGRDVTGLVLWNDDNIDYTEEVVLALAQNGAKKILDLTNALVPIDVEDVEDVDSSEEAPPAKKPAAEKAEAFTEDELLSMPVATLKIIATNMGETFSSHPSKQELVDIILEGGSTTPTEMLPQKAPQPVVEQSQSDATMVVFYSNGSSVTLNLSSDAAKAAVNDIVSKLL